MIDLHNHILPGLDDGAADLDESLEIARQFVSEGVETVAATPHLDPERRTGIPAAEVQIRVDQLRAALVQAEIPLQVVPGTELYLTPEAPELLKRGAAATLGDGPSVLVEISLLSSQPPIYLDDTLFQLQLQGYQPIFAHPERYPYVQRDPSSVAELADRNVPLQLTAPALLGEYGSKVQRTAEQLLRRGLYATGASDRHHPGPNRSLKRLYDRLVELGGSELADLLLRTNPRRLLDGRAPMQPDPIAGERQGLVQRLFRRP